MTDRDPIAEALEDLRKRATQERKEGSLQHFELVTPGVSISNGHEELWNIASSSMDIEPKFENVWTGHFNSLLPDEAVQLAVVRARESGRLSDIRTRLADDGLIPANLRDLCAFPWDAEDTESLYALGSTLSTPGTGEERVPYRIQRPEPDFDRVAERIPAKDDVRAFLPDESLFLVRVVPQSKPTP